MNIEPKEQRGIQHWWWKCLSEWAFRFKSTAASGLAPNACMRDAAEGMKSFCESKSAPFSFQIEEKVHNYVENYQRYRNDM